MILRGKNGVLKFYESSLVLHGAAPLDSITVDVVKYDGASWSNITSDVETDDASVESAFIADNNDVIYIGSTSKFAMIRYLKGNGSNYAVESGELVRTYFNGTDFDSVLAGCVDGTASGGGDCFAQDGNISFQIPRDWAIGANAFNANLDADKYYIALKATTSPSTDPDADVLCPVDGQSFEMKFAAMDFEGPIGRPLQAEILKLNRQTMGSEAHYVKGPDDVIYQPMPISFSCFIDTVYNDVSLLAALACGNPNYGTWTSTGTTTKGDTKNDGSNSNPAFVDSNKKTVNTQILWTGSNPIGLAYYETYYPEEGIKITESEEGIKLSAAGGVYGVIEDIYGFGNRY